MTDHTDVVRNWRGKYPPVAILENTRRALSASVHSARRAENIDALLLFDLAVSYQEIVDLENYIRGVRNIPLISTIPIWVLEAKKIIQEREGI